MGAMLGVVFSDNLMVLYVFWELTSISSFLLIAFWYHRKNSRYGAQKSLLITVSGGLAMLAGFIMLYVMTGSFSVREIIASIGQYTDEQSVFAGDDSCFARCIYKISPISVSYLASRCDGSTDACQCLFTFGDNGKGRDLSGRTVYTCIWWGSGMVLCSQLGWDIYVVLGFIQCSATNRFKSTACLFNN